jgi:hypothetical protein
MTEPLRFQRRAKDVEPSELADFLRVVRRALLMIVAYIDRRYGA